MVRLGLLTGACLQVVTPKLAALRDAKRRLDKANKELTGKHAKVKELNNCVALQEASPIKVCSCSCGLCNNARLT